MILPLMFAIESPTFKAVKCPSRGRRCQFNLDGSCIFCHESPTPRSSTLGLGSLNHWQEIRERMKKEAPVLKALGHEPSSNSNSTVSTTSPSLLIDQEAAKFLVQAPVGVKISMNLRERALIKLLQTWRQVDASVSLGQAAKVEFEILTKCHGDGGRNLKNNSSNVSIYASCLSSYLKKLANNDLSFVSKDGPKDDGRDEGAMFKSLGDICATAHQLKDYEYPVIDDGVELDSDTKASGDESTVPTTTAAIMEYLRSKLPGDRLSEETKQCRRCGFEFIPQTYYSSYPTVPVAGVCRYHWGKSERKPRGGRCYSCCERMVGDSQNGCQTASWHVYEEFHRPYRTSAEKGALFKFKRIAGPDGGIRALALDAEMSHTIGGYEVSRFTAVDFFTEQVILDVLVLPRHPPVLDYNSKWSGITEESYTLGPREVVSFAELRSRLSKLIGPETILIGHSLDSDLKVLQGTHDLLVDTVMLYPHRVGPPYRMSLQALAAGHLSELIQQHHSGHDSYEDALTAIKLVKKYMKDGASEPAGGEF